MLHKYSLKAPMQVVSSVHHDLVSIDAKASSKIVARLTKILAHLYGQRSSHFSVAELYPNNSHVRSWLASVLRCMD